ncbi:hypothetical protein LR48_Vigan1048s000100 [Vigna angularis]|uniref:Uncharacterized protein n=1 Tax=Vigna angularis var. angularis TaxID=157739 RepID=A0A0S3TES2_PHAAN|nr:hypothetical protein LR48_Vigan1048s000100 [Vigna angularis]BAU03623.1 hypothetical protein VIGAN_UM143900 [Vigna angularis var. angularis]
MDDARPTFVWGTNIRVEDVNDAIHRFLRDFREVSSSQGEDDKLNLHTEGKYEKLGMTGLTAYALYINLLNRHAFSFSSRNGYMKDVVKEQTLSQEASRSNNLANFEGEK